MSWPELVRTAWLAGISIEEVVVWSRYINDRRWAEREYRKLSLAEQDARLNAQLNGERE